MPPCSGPSKSQKDGDPTLSLPILRGIEQQFSCGMRITLSRVHLCTRTFEQVCVQFKCLELKIIVKTFSMFFVIVQGIWLNPDEMKGFIFRGMLIMGSFDKSPFKSFANFFSAWEIIENSFFNIQSNTEAGLQNSRNSFLYISWVIWSPIVDHNISQSSRIIFFLIFVRVNEKGRL